MKRLFLLLVFPYWLFGCALCSLYTPSATVDITLFEEDKSLKSLHMVWNFSDDFIKELKSRYDTNKNNLLDQKELERIHTILDAYVSKREYLTLVEYCPSEGAIQKVSLRTFVKSFHTAEGKLSFSFIFSLNQPLHEGDELSVSLEDKQGYFNFLIHSFTNKLSSFPKTQSNANNHILFIKVASEATPELKPPALKTLPAPSHVVVEKGWLEERLATLQERIKDTLSSVRSKGSWFSYLLFFGVSFLYGLLHAAGPGHGKALVSAYFLSSHQRYSKALLMALAIGVVHTFSAFLLTLGLHLFFDLFFKAFFDDFTYYATKVSALLILAIAFYLLIKRIKHSQEKPHIISFSAHPPSCSCGGCSEKSRSTDMGVVLGAGVVPCPGTVTIFIFALSSGEYLFGFLCALAMSLGMSFIIALTAIGTLLARHRFLAQSLHVSRYAEYVSLGVMIVLGGMLLLG
jgi:ABC-type nickel/cobalt efflux system permease component RcnA/ABC-type uncharacterized transport system substrate-binding protein